MGKELLYIMYFVFVFFHIVNWFVSLLCILQLVSELFLCIGH